MQGRQAGSMRGLQLVRAIHSLLQESWSIWVFHVYKEANDVADFLVSVGCEQQVELLVYTQPPTELQQLLLSDVTGVSTPHLIPL